ncbi:MAG: hypothetical protein R3F31_09000 [Verrucomicrobiales bacterium]
MTTLVFLKECSEIWVRHHRHHHYHPNRDLPLYAKSARTMKRMSKLTR